MKKEKIISGGDKETWIKHITLMIPLIIGVLSFLVIYGTTPLNVTNDKWIMAGYDESDIIQHYSGWTSFRNSGWSFPLGLASDMASPDGTYISYTDSIPWVAILFKLFSGVLPTTFQYFGIYTLLSFVLQGIAAYKIVYLKTGNVVYTSIATLLLVFAPIELERAFRHTGLGSQWLILFAILVYYLHKREYKTSHYIQMCILMILAIGIHPYFLPMVGIFLLLCVVEDFKRKKYKSFLGLLFILGATYFAGCIIGVLGTGVESSRSGYGYYSMNLNAVLNPMSLGNYTWSFFIKVYPQILGNYDGFNYLGAGIILAIGLSCVFVVVYGNKLSLVKCIKENCFLILALLGCFIFAISNVVTFNDRTLIEINYPEILLNICGIFRASSRIFYPVYYIIFFSCINVLWNVASKFDYYKAYVVIAFIVCIQIIDLHGCIIEKHQRMINNSEYSSILDDKVAMAIFDQNEDVLLDNFNGDSRSLAVAATKNGCKLYYSVANSGNYEKTYSYAEKIISETKRLGNIGQHIIATTDWNILKNYVKFKDIGFYNYNGIYIIAKDMDGKLTHNADGYMASSLSDDNWTNGISNE